MTPEAQSKAARQRNELRAQAETIARLQREKMELLRDLRAAEAYNARADLVPRIEALEAENARLREVLDVDPWKVGFSHWKALRARAALGETSDD